VRERVNQFFHVLLPLRPRMCTGDAGNDAFSLDSLTSTPWVSPPVPLSVISPTETEETSRSRDSRARLMGRGRLSSDVSLLSAQSSPKSSARRLVPLYPCEQTVGPPSPKPLGGRLLQVNISLNSSSSAWRLCSSLTVAASAARRSSSCRSSLDRGKGMTNLLLA